MKQKILQIYGWYGAIAILVGFFLISFNFITPNTLLYQSISLTGALGLALNALNKKDYPSGTLNIIYALIALIALIKVLSLVL